MGGGRRATRSTTRRRGAIDYEKHYRQLQTERAHNKQLRLKNSASTLRLGDHASDYWHSTTSCFPGRVTGGELQAASGKRAQETTVASSTLTLGDDPTTDLCGLDARQRR